MKHRLYVDEVGNSDLGSSRDPNHRYLSLTGVIVALDYVDSVLHPALEGLKRRYFHSHPDDPIVLHRKELVNKRQPFDALLDGAVEREFNEELLQCLRAWDYAVITITIDKLRHMEQYQVWRYDPYHYCLKALIERYVMWLQDRDVTGDVMAESRGGNEDRRLKASFERVYAEGSEWVRPELIHARLTSRQLKVKSKANNIAGLQVADLIAHPSFKAVLARRNNESLPENFGGRIATILEEVKYRRGPQGQIQGWGTKWLP
jgi:hypothetical protein